MTDLPDNFLGLPPALSDCETARFHVLPVPFEHTVSYGGGTADGPRAIIEASKQVEVFDGVCEPAQAGVCTHPDLDVAGMTPEGMVEAVRAAVLPILTGSGVPVVLGGEHTVSVGAIQAVAEHFGGDVGVVQFDAHADLRDAYEGTPWSHACVMHRVLDLGMPAVQIGVRSLSSEEQVLRRKRAITCHDAEVLMGGPGIPDTLLPEDFPACVYMTFDVDALDAGIMPATGTPEPGGLNWYTAKALVQRIAVERRVIGFDVVELAPIPGLHACDFTAAKLVYVVMGAVGRGPG